MKNRRVFFFSDKEKKLINLSQKKNKQGSQLQLEENFNRRIYFEYSNFANRRPLVVLHCSHVNTIRLSKYKKFRVFYFIDIQEQYNEVWFKAMFY